MKLSWGRRIAIVYTFFAVSTIGFVAFAMSENVELVRKDYYEASLKHDATFAAEQRAEELADQILLETSGNTVKITLPAAHADAKGTVSFYRPDNSKLDRTYPLTANKTPVSTSELAKGAYQVILEWSSGDVDYRTTRRIEVK